MGKHCPIVWDIEWSDAKIMKIKYTAGISAANQQTKTQQPTKKLAAAMEGSIEGICEERDAWGKRDAIILGVLQVG